MTLDATAPLDVTSLRGRRATGRAQRTSMGDLFERRTWADPDAIALIGVDGAYEQPEHASLSYGQADALANRFAHALHAAGLEDGDIGVLVCGNSVEAMVAKMGMAKAGVVAAPLNPALAPDVVTEVVTRIGAKAAVVDAEYAERVEPVLEAAGVRVLAVIAVGGVTDLGEAVPTFADFVAGHPVTEPDVEVHGDDIWQLLFTSGTSAAPKAAMQSHHNTYYCALAWSSTHTLGLDHERDAVLCSFLPVVFHVADAMVYSAWLLGGTVVLGRRLDAGGVARAVSDHGVTHLWAGMPQSVDAFARALAADPRADAANLATVTYGWAPLPEATYDALQEAAGHPVRVESIIGMTEVVVAHRFWLDEHEELYRATTPRDNYVGLPHPLLAARIVDPETGATLPPTPGGLGEAVYRSPGLIAGYYLDEDASTEAFAGGWFHSGDQFGYGEGRQRLMVDRLKDVIKTGGESVSSIRVEAVLHKHPAVERAAVVGVPDARWGEVVTAAVVPAAGQEVDEAELIAFAKQHLAGFEAPKRVVVVDSLPTSVGGKLRKHEVRARLAVGAPVPAMTR